ncbi:MAG: sulfatase-like hydrolase/transferase [Candidatus Pacebacteria bacterium]|nr:sulfatase-like hydrolase/transferase [Candidatus Paceibacterota bacterium]
MSDHPHIIFITADQMRFDCLSCYGNLGVQTPNLDALANESIVFDHAYCSTPLCVPTRTSIGSGKWPHTTRAIINGNRNSRHESPWHVLGREHRTFYETLCNTGYDLHHVGIQHIYADPSLEQRVPTTTIISSYDHEDYMESNGLPRTYHDFPDTDRDRDYVPAIEFDNGRMIAKRIPSARYCRPFPYDLEHFKDVYFTRCMEAEIAAADPTTPSAFVFQAWAPHPPMFAPEPYFSMYNPEDIELPENVGRWYDGMPPHVLLGTGGIRGCQLRRDEWKPIWAAYFGLVTLADECIGRVVKALKKHGFWEDALVVFTMDHGEALGSHRMFEKMTMYEESVHVPLFIKPPGGVTHGRRSQMVGHVDIGPTLCDYAGAPAIPGAWGASLRPILENTEAEWRDATFAEFNGDQARGFPSRAIFTERYKYVFHFAAGEELYDLWNDPLETRSLASDPAHQPLKNNLRERLTQWMKETDDILDIERDAEFTPPDWAAITRKSPPAGMA